MSKWEDKLDTIRALAVIGVDTATIADLVGTTAGNLQTVAKRAGIKLAGGTKVGAGAVYQVPLDMLRRDPQQPREQFDGDALNALADSLKTDGQETPVRFRLSDLDDGGAPFMIIHGERRCRAAVIAGLATIEGVLDTRDDSPAERILRQIADNEQRAALTAWDWIVAIDRLAESGLTHTEISDHITARGIKGFSRPVISNYCRLKQLPEAGIELLKSNIITPAHGKYLLQCKDERIRDRLISSISAEGTAPTTERLQWLIRVEYQESHRGLDCWGVGPTCDFDWETTCKECEHCHKAEMYHFCTNPLDDCFNGHQAAAERRRATERQASLLQDNDEDEDDDLEGIDLEALKQSDPEEAARIEKRIEQREEWRQRQEGNDRHRALKRKIVSQVDHCERLDVLIVLALQLVLTDWDLYEQDDEQLNLSQWLERFALDRTAMLRMIAREQLDGWIAADALPHIARMLDLDPEADYRETDPQHDMENAA